MKQVFRKITAALCAGLMLTAVTVPCVSAEETSPRLPSEKTVADLERELHDKASNLGFEDPVYASAAVGVFQGEEILYTGYFGETDMENHIPADENSVYEWGSISKTLIWVSAMQLYEQGRLDLDRDVRDYLPEGFFQKLSYDEPITMMNLMNHNAGWQETTLSIWKTDEKEIGALGEELQAIEPAQLHRPGEVAAYSNYGAAVAGYVIECVAGQDYCDYVHEHIFAPLGMEHTALSPAHSDNDWVYAHRPETKSYRFMLGNRIDLGSCLNYIPGYPAGAAAGTLSDLMTYAQALVNADAPLFQSPETQALLYTGTDFYGSSDIPLCAHGFWCMEYAVRTYGHTGATTAGQANMLFDLESGTGLVIMVNEPDGNSFLTDTPAWVFGELPPDKYASAAAEEVTFSGYYTSARSTYRGMLRLMPYLTAIPLSGVGAARKIGEDLYQIDLGDSAVLLGGKTYPDGRIGLQQPSADLLQERSYLAMLCLLTVYLLLAVASVFLFLIRRKLKKHGKWTAYRGAAVMAAGQAARLISVLVLLGTFMFYLQNSGGIPYTVGAVLGIAQMLCAAVCGASAVTTCVLALSRRQEKKLTVRYLLNTVGCVLPVLAIVCFEMYRFWGC